MEGRWTIHTMRMGVPGTATISGAITDDLPVPVVPCDEEAIERAVAAIANQGVMSHRKYVEIILRAAGGTDADAR